MKRIALTAALTFALAAPAFANDQLAASLGVDAGDYTVAQLIQLRTAEENNDHVYANFLRNGGGNEVVSTQSFGGQSGSDFLLRTLEEDDEHIQAAHIRNGGGAEVVSTQSFGPSSDAVDFLIRSLEEDDERIQANYIRSTLN